MRDAGWGVGGAGGWVGPAPAGMPLVGACSANG